MILAGDMMKSSPVRDNARIEEEKLFGLMSIPVRANMEITVELTPKLRNLERIIRKAEKALVCFSGGVDSTLLLYFCKEYLGPQNVLALTVSSSASLPGEIKDCRTLARQFGVEHLIVEKNILDTREVAEGDPRRCYFCKRGLCRLAREEADKRHIKTIFEGSNFDDLQDYRPGYEAVKEFSIASPLLEAGFSKVEIRETSRSCQLPTWDRPALPCLVTRFPYGVRITSEDLSRVGACESYLLELGFQLFRVRCHGETARIELPPAEISLFSDPVLRQKIVSRFKKEGFTFVALDLEGYRTGSLNELLERNLHS